MLTEQKPPCAAQFGVPKLDAQRLVSDWLWSRPVKKASLRGSLARTGASQETARSSASSQEISLNLPSPRSPTRSRGAVSLAGDRCCMMPAAPLPQITPRFTGWRLLPSMCRIAPSLRCTRIPQRQAHM
jgi:hypothetical protein